jgi:hypothetical protein
MEYRMNLESLKNRIDQDIAILTRDYDHGKKGWNLPKDQIEERQAKIRELRFVLQAAMEKEIAATGPPDQVKMLRPLVLRREELKEKSEDGKQFTFHPAQKIKIAIKVCSHYPIEDMDALDNSEFTRLNVHLASCPDVREEIVEEDLFVVKHSRGNLNCSGCLEAPPTESPLLKKHIVFCPKFVQALVDLGPAKYEETFKRTNPDLPVCYAGLLHSEFKIDGRAGIWTRKCDTCGYETKEEKELCPQNTDTHEFHVGVDMGFSSDSEVISCICPECQELMFTVSSEEKNIKQLTAQHDEIINKHWATKHPDKEQEKKD